IKGAVLDLDARSFAHVRRAAFPAPIASLPPLHFEVDPRQVVEATRALIDDLARDAPDCAGIVLCSQMHGLVLMDARGEPASNAITWRDQRALGPHPEGGTVFEQLERRVGPQDRQLLGNELRPSLPLCGLFSMSELGQLPSDATAAALPELVRRRPPQRRARSTWPHATGTARCLRRWGWVGCAGRRSRTFAGRWAKRTWAGAGCRATRRSAISSARCLARRSCPASCR